MEYINNKYRKLKSIYEDIIFNDANEYINELRNTWKEDSRVKFVFKYESVFPVEYSNNIRK